MSLLVPSPWTTVTVMVLLPAVSSSPAASLEATSLEAASLETASLLTSEETALEAVSLLELSPLPQAVMPRASTKASTRAKLFFTVAVTCFMFSTSQI